MLKMRWSSQDQVILLKSGDEVEIRRLYLKKGDHIQEIQEIYLDTSLAPPRLLADESHQFLLQPVYFLMLLLNVLPGHLGGQRDVIPQM